jgi:TPR repeat protein
LHEKGLRGYKKDLLKAKAYYEKSAAQDYDEAVIACQRLKFGTLPCFGSARKWII